MFPRSRIRPRLSAARTWLAVWAGVLLAPVRVFADWFGPTIVIDEHATSFDLRERPHGWGSSVPLAQACSRRVSRAPSLKGGL